MRLLTRPDCPLGRQVRIAALDRAVGLAVERVGDARLLDGVGPLRRTPVLIADDGLALHDVGAILSYLDAHHGGPPLIPGEQRWIALDRIALCGQLIDLIARRGDELHRPAPSQSRAAVEALDDGIWRMLAWLDERIDGFGEGAGPLTGDRIAAACALDFADFRYSLHWRLTFTKASRWLTAMHRDRSIAETAFDAASAAGAQPS